MAAGFVIGGSVGIVLTIAGQLSGLHSLETQEQVSAFLKDRPGSGLGVDLETALEWMRVILMIVAGCATAAAVLGVQVLRRSRGARKLLTLLAIPIFLGGFVAGGFLTALVAASIALLWVGPSGQWLHDGPPTSNRGFLDRPRVPASMPADAEQPSPAVSPTSPAAAPQSSQSSPPSPTARRLFEDQPQSAPQRGRPPDAVVWACVLVWAFCGLVVVVMAATVALVAGDPAFVLDQLRNQDEDLAVQDTDVLVNATYATAAVLVVWSLVAAALAVLAYRRRPPGRVGVLVSSAVAGVLCLAGVFASFVLILPAGAALATVALLNRPEVRAWYRARGS
jgi:hypothetical protein